MYRLRMGDLSVVGSSPEILVRLEGDEIQLRPIAGTRPRGSDPAEDRRLEAELLSDPKEIAEHEPFRRGIYAGAVGYFDLQGSMDFCIAIRTIVMSGEEAMIQAGAGIVADSDPAREWDEILSKAKILFRAVGVSPEALEAP